MSMCQVDHVEIHLELVDFPSVQARILHLPDVTVAMLVFIYYVIHMH